MQATTRPRSRRPGRVRGAPAVERPPYVIPSLADIAAIPANGLTVASTFAGAGGSSTGWAIAGYRVVWANEFHPPAADSYARNHPDTILDRRDIRTVHGADIVAALDGRVPDVLDGSPPCQDFSMAGKRTRGWGEARQHGDGTRQRSDDLFGEYIRLVGELRPRVFVAENVKGLVTGAAKGQFKRIMAGLAAQGYRVEARILDAQWLGVPQRRRRVIIIGVRTDLDNDPAFPRPLPYRYSILDACPWLGGFDSIRGGYGFDGADDPRPLDEPAPTIGAVAESHDRWLLRHNHTSGMKRTGRLELDEPAVTITATEGGIDLVRPGALRHWDTHGHQAPADQPLDDVAPTVSTSPSRVRLVYEHNWYNHTRDVDEGDEPASTIGASGICGISASRALVDDGASQRRLTIGEVKRLCSFPDDYELTGKYSEQWARLGNSVPPLMMAAVARALVPVLESAGGPA